MLEIEGVSIRFGDNPEAVSDTTFTVGDGDRLAVVGETGSGKSVLLLAALGLLPASARVTGSIRLNGRELLGCREREFNQIRGKRSPIFRREAGMGSIHSIPWAASFARPFESISPVPGEKRWFRRPRCWSPLGWSMARLCAAAILFSSPAVCASGY